MKRCAAHPEAKRNKAGGCCACAIEATKRWRQNNPDKVKALHRRQAQRPQKKLQRRLWSFKAQGMNPVEAEAALRAHDGHCECCGANSPGGRKGWNVDHDHATGRVRGILCNHCNLAIGRLGDTLEGVLRAAKYLQKGSA